MTCIPKSYLDEDETDPIICVRKARRRAPRLVVESDSEDDEGSPRNFPKRNNNINEATSAYNEQNQFQPQAATWESFNETQGDYLYAPSRSVSPAPSLLSPGSLSSRQDSVCSLNGMMSNPNPVKWTSAGFDPSTMKERTNSSDSVYPMMEESIKAAPPSPVLGSASPGHINDLQKGIPCDLLGQAARLAEMAILADDIMDLDVN